MQRAKLNRGQVASGQPAEAVLAAKAGQLVCRDCGKSSSSKEAIKGSRQALRCGLCGGILDREVKRAE